MNDPIIWLAEDQYAEDDWQAAGKNNPAIEWLEAEFTYQWITCIFRDPDLVPGPHSLRPMFEIIDQQTGSETEPDVAMAICELDYTDPGRWWL